MLDTFFSALQPEKSLIFLYAKRTPLADDPRRVLVGVGRITSVGPAQEHTYSGITRGKLRGLMWERAISHSIRPEGFDGFVLPTNSCLPWPSETATLTFLSLSHSHLKKPSTHSAMSLSTSTMTWPLQASYRWPTRFVSSRGTSPAREIGSSNGSPNASLRSGNSAGLSRASAVLFTLSRSDTGRCSR